jgi:hypothetical protein
LLNSEGHRLRLNVDHHFLNQQTLENYEYSWEPVEFVVLGDLVKQIGVYVNSLGDEE